MMRGISFGDNPSGKGAQGAMDNETPVPGE
jgi:hypothetical protein